MELKEAVKSSRTKVSFFDKAEREFFLQKAKSRFLNNSDRNTSFFHSIVKRNNSRNAIAFICRDDGSITHDQDEIASQFINFYTSLFGAHVEAKPIDPTVLAVGPSLEDAQKLELIHSVIPAEIKDALFNIGNDKAPVPDGYTSAFFKINWDFIRIEIVAAVKEFFTSGQLLRRLNATIIALIPKTTINPKGICFHSSSF